MKSTEVQNPQHKVLRYNFVDMSLADGLALLCGQHKYIHSCSLFILSWLFAGVRIQYHIGHRATYHTYACALRLAN